MIGQLFGKVVVLLAQQDGHVATVGQHADHATDVLDDAGLYAFGGLVQNQDFGLWRQRARYIFHDGTRLYRGSTLSWPLAAIRDVVTERSGVGVASLRLVVDDDSEVTRPLVPLPLLEGSPEAVRGGVLFAAAGMRGVPMGVTVN